MISSSPRWDSPDNSDPRMGGASVPIAGWISNRRRICWLSTHDESFVCNILDRNKWLELDHRCKHDGYCQYRNWPRTVNGECNAGCRCLQQDPWRTNGQKWTDGWWHPRRWLVRYLPLTRFPSSPPSLFYAGQHAGLLYNGNYGSSCIFSLKSLLFILSKERTSEASIPCHIFKIITWNILSALMMCMTWNLLLLGQYTKPQALHARLSYR